VPEVNIIVKAKDQVSSVFKNINKNLFGFNENLLLAGTVGVGALAVVGAAAGKLAWDAAQVEPTVMTFENLTQEIGSTADEMLTSLRPATLGIVSDIDLMKAANKLMMMGLAESEEEAANLAEAAVKLGMAMGNDALPSLEDFTLMLANQSILRMDTFGLSSGRAREEINKLVDEGLSKEEAFKLVVLDQANDRLKDLGDFGDTAKVKMGALQTKFGNVKDELGDALLPALETLLDDLIIPLADAIADDLAPVLAETLPGAIEATVGALQGVADLLGDILEAIQRLDEWTATYLAPPELRGYQGRTVAAGYAEESYLGQSEGGRWGQRATINVYGVPGVAEYLRDVEGHTVAP